MAASIKHGVKLGILLGLLYIANVQILTWLGLGLTSWVFGIDLALLLIVVYATHVTYKSKNENVLAIKDALLLNLAVILISALINTTYMYIYITMIDPTWVDKVAEIRRLELVENGVDSGAIEGRIAAFRTNYTLGGMYTTGILLPALWSFLFAGIVVLFTRSKPAVSQG